MNAGLYTSQSLSSISAHHYCWEELMNNKQHAIQA